MSTFAAAAPAIALAALKAEAEAAVRGIADDVAIVLPAIELLLLLLKLWKQKKDMQGEEQQLTSKVETKAAVGRAEVNYTYCRASPAIASVAPAERQELH